MELIEFEEKIIWEELIDKATNIKYCKNEKDYVPEVEDIESGEDAAMNCLLGINGFLTKNRLKLY